MEMKRKEKGGEGGRELLLCIHVHVHIQCSIKTQLLIV